MRRYYIRLKTTYGPNFRVLPHHIHIYSFNGVLPVPTALVVNRCYSLAHIGKILIHAAAVLYLEPETEDYRDKFEVFIQSLLERSRIGMSVVGPPDGGRSLVFIFAP